mgnify:CR=1 FL=1
MPRACASRPRNAQPPLAAPPPPRQDGTLPQPGPDRWPARWTASSTDSTPCLAGTARSRSSRSGWPRATRARRWSIARTCTRFAPARAFAQLVADTFARETDQVLGHLALLLDQTERVQATEPRSTTERLTPERQAAAEKLLSQPRLLDRAAAVMDQLGYVGEEVPKRLAFLVATSRLLAKPLSAIVFAPSGQREVGAAGDRGQAHARGGGRVPVAAHAPGALLRRSRAPAPQAGAGGRARRRGRGGRLDPHPPEPRLSAAAWPRRWSGPGSRSRSCSTCSGTARWRPRSTTWTWTRTSCGERSSGWPGDDPRERACVPCGG